ncbi:MAG: hypothetical protein RLZZ297_1269 [Chloroflexota bacterium]|jgi:predicted DCC family thiol-disulfide oxidoreductase YuxK
MNTLPPTILLFDGVCNLCAGVVRWVLPRDPAGVVAFASLQSPIGGELCTQHGISATALGSVVLIHQGRAYVESDAVLVLIGLLPGPLRVFAGLRVVPRGLRDMVYRWVARNRYRWFGQSESCMLAQPGYRERFLSD